VTVEIKHNIVAGLAYRLAIARRHPTSFGGLCINPPYPVGITFVGIVDTFTTQQRERKKEKKE
jgi:hypothetical protein